MKPIKDREEGACFLQTDPRAGTKRWIILCIPMRRGRERWGRGSKEEGEGERETGSGAGAQYLGQM